MQKMLNNKKADLTANQIVTIVILIVSFAVILLFFFMLNLKGAADIEACHNSVVMKSIPVFGKLVKGYSCETQDVLIKETEPEKIYAELAELQRNCFWMFGEKKIEFAVDTCAVCNIIEFEKKDMKLPSYDYYRYLEKTNVPGEDFNYLFYFYKKADLQPQSKNDISINTNEKYIILFKSEEFTEIPLTDIRFINPFKSGFAVSNAIGIAPYNSETISAMDCEQFATSA